jgi:MFS family permease
MGFQILIGLSVLLRMFSIFAQQRILATSSMPQTEGTENTRRQLRIIFDRKPLVRLFVFGATFGFATNLFGPFFNVFLYDGLGRSVADVSMLIVITNVTGAISLPAWGQLCSRFGSRPTMNVALAAWVIPGFLWATLTPENLWILKFLYASGGIFSAGFILGSFNLLLRLVPPEAKTTAISMNVAATSLAAAVAPILGGFILQHAWSLGWGKLHVYHSMSIVHHSVVLLSGLVLLRVVEPNSAPLGRVVGAMRSYRQILALLGMSFLVNYVFTKTRPDDTE